MRDFLIQVAAGSIAGMVPFLLTWRRGSNPPVDLSQAAISGDVAVDRSDHSSREYNLHLHMARSQAPSDSSGRQDVNDADRMIPPVILFSVGIVAMVLLAASYLLVRDNALFAFKVATTALCSYSFGVIVVMVSQGRVGGYFSLSLAVAAISTVVTLLNRRWLGNAGLYSDRVEYLLASGRQLTPGDMAVYLTSEEVTFLAIQALGVLLTGLFLLLTAAVCGALAGSALRGRGQKLVTAKWTKRRSAVALAFGLLAVLSMGFCSGRVVTSSPRLVDLLPLGTGKPTLSLDASARLSPKNRWANLLCVRAIDESEDIPLGPVLLERRPVGKGGSGRWQEVGGAMTFSENGTYCRELVSTNRSVFYRFSTESGGKPVRSNTISVVPVQR